MKRCAFCGKRVWPWQRRGWMVGIGGRVEWWHGKCWKWNG